MIIFERLKWKNFLSTGNLWTEVDLNKNKSTLIIGENGAGKSTILDALSFVLYNKAYRNITKPQLVNTINKKGLEVQIDFTIGPHRYRVVRGIKPNIFEVYVNGKLQNQDDKNRDYQESLEKNILKMNHKSFCQIVILGSASFTPFMQLAAGARREIIEDLLELGIFTTMNTLNKNHIQTLQNEITDNDYQIKLTEERIRLYRKHAEELTQNKIALKEQKVREITETQGNIAKLEEQIEELMSRSVELGASIADKSKVAKTVADGQKIENQLKNKLSNIQKEIKFFTDNTNCPTCSQPITEHFKAEAVSCRDSEISKVQKGLTDLADHVRTYQDRLKEIEAINNEITKINTDIAVNNASIKSAQEYIKKLQKEINGLEKETQVTNTENGNALNLDLKRHNERKEQLINKSEVLRDAALILKDTGIKSRFIKQYVPIINKLINKYLAAMEFYVNFELDETFNETIKSRHRDDFTYASFSEGEKMRINLAILFTWRAIAKLRNSASTNILIMDEVFDSSLDASGTEEFMKILNNLTSDINTFVISHKGDQLIDRFENVIRFEKYKEFSRMVA